MPSKINISADMNIKHGTIVGTDDKNAYGIDLPMCLLHKSWYPDTIDEKVKRYNALGIPCSHPFEMKNAGKPEVLPDWAHV